MTYNLTAVSSNSTSFVVFTQNVNNILIDGWLGLLLLIGLSSVVMLSLLFSTNDAQKAIGATSFVAFILSIFLRAMSLLSNRIMIACILLCAVAIAFSWRDK